MYSDDWWQAYPNWKSNKFWDNYKGIFRLVLLAVCDDELCFYMFDVGEYGSNNDSGVLANSNVGERFERRIFNLPESKHLHECKFSLLPCYLLGD